MSSDPLAMSCDAWRGHLVPKIRALREGSHEIDKSISTSSDHQSSTNESLTIPSITKVGGHIVLGNESKRSHCAEALQEKPVPCKPRTVIEKSIMHPYQISCRMLRLGTQKKLVLDSIPGRLGNNLIQVAWIATMAMENSGGWTFGVADAGKQANEMRMYPFLSNVLKGNFPVGARVKEKPLWKPGCPWSNDDDFFQNYEWLRPHRASLRCLYHTEGEGISDAMKILGPNDVVVHIRLIKAEVPNPGAPKWLNADAPVSYFVGALQDIDKSLEVIGGIRTTWIVLEPGLDNNPMAKEIFSGMEAAGFKLRVHGGSAVQDHYLARKAANLVTSIGTYSWTAAYLSEAESIHMPYCSYQEPGWLPWANLFIDDDPRIVWHDYCGPHSGNADLVLDSDSLFAGLVKKRMSESEKCMPRPHS